VGSRTLKAAHFELRDWCDDMRRTATPAALIRAIEDRMEHETDPERLDVLNMLVAREHRKQGNEAEADAISARDPVRQVHDWYSAWTRKHRDVGLIAALEARVRDETHPAKLQTLRRLLASEYEANRNYTSAEALYREEFNADPDRPMPLISLAYQKLSGEKDPDAAMRIIDQAFEAAMRSGDFRRHALSTKARIALRLKDYRCMEEVLTQIVEMKFKREDADIGVERDFFDALPLGSIDPDVARRYDEFCRVRGVPIHPDSLDELPKWSELEEGAWKSSEEPKQASGPDKKK